MVPSTRLSLLCSQETPPPPFQVKPAGGLRDIATHRHNNYSLLRDLRGTEYYYLLYPSKKEVKETGSK